jgi:hypothetical protein
LPSETGHQQINNPSKLRTCKNLGEQYPHNPWDSELRKYLQGDRLTRMKNVNGCDHDNTNTALENSTA